MAGDDTLSCDHRIVDGREAVTFLMRAPADLFWGARYGRVRDPFGHVWAFNAPLQRP